MITSSIPKSSVLWLPMPWGASWLHPWPACSLDSCILEIRLGILCACGRRECSEGSSGAWTLSVFIESHHSSHGVCEREWALLDAVAMLMLRGSCLPSVKTNAGWISQGTVPWEDMNRPQTPPKTSSYCSWSLYHQCRCLCSSPTPTARAKLWTTSLSLNTSYATVWHKH